VGFKYGSHSNGLKCFLMLRSDGSEEGISISKCLNGLLPKVAGGTKRPREQDAEAAQDAPAAKKQQGLKIRPGCVVVITGIPKATQYQAVRTACEAIGDCRFVETNEKPKKKKGKGKGKAEDEGKGKAKPPEDADSDGEDVPLIAKARFGDAEGAAKAVKELKEVGGAPVTLRIMEGEEEREFWEKLLERAERAARVNSMQKKIANHFRSSVRSARRKSALNTKKSMLSRAVNSSTTPSMSVKLPSVASDMVGSNH